GRLARDFLLLAPADTLFGAFDHEVEELVGLERIARQPVVEGVLDRLLDDALSLGSGQAVLGLALEFRLAHEHREHHGGSRHCVFRGDAGGALALADALGVILQPAQQRAADTGFMRATVLGRNGVAIGREEAVSVRCPGDRPFAGAMRAGARGFAGEDVRMHQRVGMDGGREVILQAAGEVEGVFRRHIFDALEQLRCAAPADFDAAEQIRLGARHLEQALRLEGGLRAENLRIRLEADPGAAAVVDLAEVLELAFGMAALECHAVELLAARDLDLEPRGQRVDDGDADAMQAAGGLVDFRVEFAARMQRAHDDFERRLFRKFRMRIDGDAAAIVRDRQKAVRRELDLDEGGVAGQGLIHRVVDDFGKQMMQRLLVCAADIHARPAPDCFQSLQDLDVARGIAGLGRGGAGGNLERRTVFRLGGGKKVVGFSFCSGFQSFRHGSSCKRTSRIGRIASPDYATDGPQNVTAAAYTGAVRNTMTAKRAIAVSMISDPTMGMATKALPCVTTTATPAGSRIPPTIWSQPWSFANWLAPAAGTRR